MFDALLQNLEQSRRDLLQHCTASGDHRAQYHPDLSPAGWHLGHCIFTENYWVREVLLGTSACDEEQKSLYIPEHSTKPGRGKLLPKQQDLLAWARESHTENTRLLQQHRHKRHDLLEDDFLLHFLIQHYAQHLETLKLAQHQAALKKANGFDVDYSLNSQPLKRDAAILESAHYSVGRKLLHLPYDNESPAHDVTLAQIEIAKRPISNAEYLYFMQDDGYDNKRYWTDAGWQWLQDNPVSCPEYWHATPTGSWSGISIDGLQPLQPNAPVHGINHHEATAFANWADARLPHENEWEAACNAGLLQNTGQVWEWCSNSFYPYDGFKAYPYNGYSVPYFDGAHYTLKGGSYLTQPVIKRGTFRNYYEADKRFLFAGLRLVFN